ncbi:unnamed protein product [Lymnaea stagnalis]|uniref:Solute carrier family 43 member 3 n=1 Tax=Lymnaea stagnalis TaxID=6523 RepID=A0AAV2HJE8_LYMST
MKPANPRFRILYAVWALLECLGFGGLIYGWGSLVYILKDEGLYYDLCSSSNLSTETNSSVLLAATSNASSSSNASDENKGFQSHNNSCLEMDDRLSLVFTIGAAMFCVGCFLMGQVNYKFGTRISRIGATALFFVGSLMIAFTSNDVPWLIFPGLSLLGTGGITFLMTNMQISALFPKFGSFIVGLLCGGFDSSSGIQLMVKFGYENGISRQTSYIILACTNLLTLISTFLFLPKDFIQKPAVRNRRDADIAGDLDAAVELRDKRSDELTQQPEDKRTLLQCVLSSIYLLHVFWICVLQLRFYFLIGSLNKTLEILLHKNGDEVSHYTNVSTIVLMLGIITSPFAGFVCDFQKQFFVNSKSPLRKVLMPTVIPLTLTTTLCIILSSLILFEEPTLLYAVYVCLLFFRSFMYTIGAGYISALFPSSYFAILYGILILAGGVVSMFQYVFFNWADSQGFFQVNLFLLFLMFSTYVHPIYQWWSCRQAENTILLMDPI